MLGEMIFLQTYGSGSFGNVINQLESAGAFTYVLPFLFIFTLIFGILSRTKIFEKNQGINFILALAVALMGLQTNYVSNFFAIVSPYLGVGLIIVLMIAIFLGLFAPKENWVIYTMVGVSAIILINILLGIAKDTGSGWYTWWTQYSTLIITGTVLVILFLIFRGSESETKYGDIVPKLISDLAGK